jgi:hypothetical protein
VSAGPYINYCAEAGTKNEPGTFVVPVQKKIWKIGSSHHVSMLKITLISFSGVLEPLSPLNRAKSG